VTRLERDLLNMIQNDFPLEPRPFFTIAGKLNVSEKTFLATLRRLHNAGILRAIRPLISWHALGFKTVLVGMKVAPQRMEAVARIINRIDGVTHNYARDGALNLWFTLIYDTPDQKELLFDRLCRMRGVYDLREFTALKTYKLGLVLDV
jgi:DNA-binding Lrp family transcriptional regulator